MAVKASASVTITRGVDISGWTRYYQLKADGTNPPERPTDHQPIPSGWTDTEPGYTSGSSQTLYFVDQTTFSDGDILYSSVSISSSYEAAKDADSTAISARKRATAKYGYCTTGPGITAKIVTCEDFILFDGAVINVLFSLGIYTSGGSSSFSLNVNNQGEKFVLLNGEYISATNPFRVAANTTVMFVYTHIQAGDQGYWLAVPTDSILRGTCTIAANTENKTVSIANAILHIGSVAVIKFTYGNTSSSPKLALSDLGYFPIDTKTPPMWVDNKTMSFTLEYESGTGLYWKVNADSFKDNFYHDDTGAHIKSELGNQELLLASDSIQFKESSNVLAKYTATLIELGKNAITSVVSMCKGLINIRGKVYREEDDSRIYSETVVGEMSSSVDVDDDYYTNISTVEFENDFHVSMLTNLNTDPVVGTRIPLEPKIRIRAGVNRPGGTSNEAYSEIDIHAKNIFFTGDGLLYGGIYMNYMPLYSGSPNGASNKLIVGADGYPYDGDGNKISTSYTRRNVTVTNLNTGLSTGHYTYAAGATGAPTSNSGGSLFVFRTSATYQHQFAFPNNSQGTDHVYHRMRYVNSDSASSYTEWKLISMNGHSHESLNSFTTLLEVSYTPSAADVWDRVGTATTSKFTISEPTLLYMYCSSRRSGFGVHSTGSSATVTRTDSFNCVDPDGNLRRSPIFYLTTGSYYAYAKSPGTSAATVRVYKINGYN